ncbi:MAG: dTMP kinase [Bdellovibrionaceae bacterium]|nr:dTMP kinase [Bdellovibrio sp.]
MIFLAFEGLDGSGKSTLMRQLEEHLSEKKISFLKTREPGGTPVGDQLREIILKKSSDAPTARTELLLYEASRAQHVDCVIRPALEQKKWVLCDRFSASSIAFQAGGRQISESQVEWLNDFATGSLEPHLNILLDLTVEESKKRRVNRATQVGVAEDRMESEAELFHQRVRKAFLDQGQKKPKAWLILDASQTPEKLFELLKTELKERQWLA